MTKAVFSAYFSKPLIFRNVIGGREFCIPRLKLKCYDESYLKNLSTPISFCHRPEIWISGVCVFRRQEVRAFYTVLAAFFGMTPHLKTRQQTRSTQKFCGRGKRYLSDLASFSAPVIKMSQINDVRPLIQGESQTCYGFQFLF